MNAPSLKRALEWALDLLDMYDKRLASIDGAHKVYTPTHEAGKAKARAVLNGAIDPVIPVPEQEPEWQKQVTDLIPLIRIAVMDGYNKQPLDTVDGWMEEIKKRVLLFYLAVRDEYCFDGARND